MELNKITNKISSDKNLLKLKSLDKLKKDNGNAETKNTVLIQSNKITHITKSTKIIPHRIKEIKDISNGNTLYINNILL